MNSAVKKTSEPSMDDIISSIRNIIADDTQEASPAAAVQAALEVPAPIVQLTENQIADPIAQANAGETAAVLAPANTVIDPLAGAEIATEIDAVPGVAVAVAIPIEQSVAVAPDVVQLEPVQAIASTPVPTEIIPQIETISVQKSPEINVQMTAASEVPAAIPAEPVQQVAISSETSLDDAVQSEAVAPIAAAAPLVPSLDALTDQVAAAGIAEVQPAMSLADRLQGTTPDPVEEMMLSTPENADGVNADVNPDHILDGMDQSPVAAMETSSPSEHGIAPAAPFAEISEEPIVLDASQVTPEDAAAITAVAAATSEALAGRTTPVEKTGNSLEDSVKEMLKPMIRDWLDENMPRILEGAIKEEVKVPGTDDV